MTTLVGHVPDITKYLADKTLGEQTIYEKFWPL